MTPDVPGDALRPANPPESGEAGQQVPPEVLRAIPKVALHDHLDGGLRPTTLVELATEAGHELPTTDPGALATWFFEAANSGSLERYLETFDHTVAVMQTREALVRVAREFVLDQAADGVVYAEARWAPEQHLRAGLGLDEAVAAVAEGLHAGMAEAASAGHPVVARQIITAMRHADRSPEIAELAVRHARGDDDHLVCGFDIAGAEAGFPPSNHLEAFRYLADHGLPYTIHAGEAAGVESVADAVEVCGAHRLGHGVRLAEDITGPTATLVRERQVPLEVCPSSNLQTGIADTIADHPVDRLYRAGMAVTISCDNRLVSRTTLSREYALLVEAFGWTRDDIRLSVERAVAAAFVDDATRDQLLARVDRLWPDGLDRT